MKLFYTNIIALLAASCLLLSCNGQSSRSNTRITEYLYGVEYDDYDFEAGVKALEHYKPAAAGCSEVRKGDFVGRNLDWYINNDASAVIKVNHSDKRFGSIGVVGCCTKFSCDFAASGEYADIYNILPMFTVDGVNEAGLYAGVNVMPTGETSFDESRWNSGAWGLGAAFTNPGAEKSYCVTYLVRVLLDNASSVSDAMTLVRSINWFEPSGFPHEGESQSFHWLISDSKTSVVLEFIDNVPCFTACDSITEPSYGNIMTNFTNKLMADAGLVQTSGAGYERWDILAAAYPETEESFDGMTELMKKVWYTQFYTAEADAPGFLMTEIASAKHPAGQLYGNTDYQNTEEWESIIAGVKEDFANPDNWHSDNSTVWYTTHTSVYNIADKELHLILHEGYDDQNEVLSFSYSDSHFAKPRRK